MKYNALSYKVWLALKAVINAWQILSDEIEIIGLIRIKEEIEIIDVSFDDLSLQEIRDFLFDAVRELEHARTALLQRKGKHEVSDAIIGYAGKAIFGMILYAIRQAEEVLDETWHGE